MNSIRISIKANEELQEILVSELNELGADGFEQTNDQLVAYFPELNFNSYEVNQLLSGYEYDSGVVQEQNWNEVWEKNFQPIIVEGFCAVRADFHDPISTVPHEIIITPKMSFGTGHHATTYMMMAQMKEMDLENKIVFDFGTGTGILSILSEKMGAAKIVAIDNDEWSIKNAEENFNRNNCTRAELKLSGAVPDTQFDIILANINRNVIMENLTDMVNCLHEKGYMLLSGLLVTDEADMIRACENLQLRLLKKSDRNNWISLLFIK